MRKTGPCMADQLYKPNGLLAAGRQCESSLAITHFPSAFFPTRLPGGRLYLCLSFLLINLFSRVP